MRLLKLLVLAAAILVAFNWWKGKDIESVTAAVSEQSPNGFIPVLMPDSARPDAVMIFAPENCPSDAAQRAEDLFQELKRAGIPAIRSASFRLSVNNPTAEQRAAVERATEVVNGAIPAVFINGMGKANPSADEVIAEYHRTM
jgi:hypothetical protein